MKWIKASERLPEKFVELNLRVVTLPKHGYFDGTGFYRSDDQHNAREWLGTIAQVEWLDQPAESSLSITEQEQDQLWSEAKAMGVSQVIENRGRQSDTDIITNSIEQLKQSFTITRKK